MSMLNKINRLLSKSRFVKKTQRFKKNEEGVTAIEFGIVGAPFFLLVFAIIETSIFFFANQYLETVTDDVARLYRTGQLANISTQTDLKLELCNRIVALFDCNQIKVSVDVEDEFSDLPPPTDTSNTANFDAAGNFTPPERFPPEVCPLRVLQLSASYEWPIYANYSAPLISPGLNDSALIHVTAVVQTEDFPTPAGSTC